MSSPSRSRMRWLAFVLIGLVGGVLSGAFGVGGGILMVPLLIAFAGFDQRQAASTSLIAILPASVAGAATYAARGEIDLVAGAITAVGAIAGSLLGAFLLRRIPLGVLRILFIALLVAVAIRTALVPAERGGTGIDLGQWWTIPGLVLLGVFLGTASGVFGIGGGVIAVPGLTALFGASDLVAKGTSLVVMIPTSLTGTIANLRARAVELGPGLVLGLSATAASFAGVALAFLIPPALSGALFAVLLLVAAAQLTVRDVRARRAARAARMTQATDPAP